MHVRAIAQRRSASFLFGVASVLAICLLLLLWQVVRATGACPLPERDVAADGSATLDRAHPWVEQRVVVDLDAEVMASEFQPAVTLGVVPTTDPPSSDVDRTRVQILFLDDETSEVLPRIGAPETAARPYGDRPGATIALHCAPDVPCHRTIRVALVLADPQPSQAVAVSWVVGLKVTYPDELVCVPPYAGKMTLTPDPPVVHAAADVARAALPSESVSRELSTRHVVIRTSGAHVAVDGPTTTVLRVTVDPPKTPGYGWRGWIRVLPDGSSTPSVDGGLGAQFPPRRQTVDAPVLTDCDPVVPCERGYWVVLQSFSGVPPWDRDPFGDPAIDPFDWSAEVLQLGSGASKSGLTAARDHQDTGLASMTTLEIPNQAFTMPHSDAAWAIDTTFTMPRPTMVDGLDPAAAAMALIPLKIEGVDVSATVTGSGSTDVTARFNGGQTGYLLAHPLDGCLAPAVGATCTTTIRFVVDIPPQQEYGSQHVGADVDWAMRLHGLPLGTTYQIAEPVELPRPMRLQAGPLLMAAFLVVLSAVVAVVATRRLRSRRGRIA